jgi:hypothetical protein
MLFQDVHVLDGNQSLRAGYLASFIHSACHSVSLYSLPVRAQTRLSPMTLLKNVLNGQA